MAIESEQRGGARMGHSKRRPISAIYGGLLAVIMLALVGCASAPQAPESLAPVVVFSCSDVAVLTFSWNAPDDTVFEEHEQTQGREVTSFSAGVGEALARQAAATFSAAGVTATPVSMDPASSYQHEVEVLKEEGYACVLLGRVERYEERIGSDWSVNRPASVAFRLLLMETSTGRVVWKGSFDETQQPLSENLLTLKTFLRRKARWVTAEDLAQSGFDRLVAAMVHAGANPNSTDGNAGGQ